jgi:hypothetical protein
MAFRPRSAARGGWGWRADRWVPGPHPPLLARGVSWADARNGRSRTRTGRSIAVEHTTAEEKTAKSNATPRSVAVAQVGAVSLRSLR